MLRFLLLFDSCIHFAPSFVIYSLRTFLCYLFTSHLPLLPIYFAPSFVTYSLRTFLSRERPAAAL